MSGVLKLQLCCVSISDSPGDVVLAFRNISTTIEKEYCLERELNRTFLYIIRGKNIPESTPKPIKNVFCRAMRTAKNLSKMFFVGPCAQLKTFEKTVL